MEFGSGISRKVNVKSCEALVPCPLPFDSSITFLFAHYLFRRSKKVRWMPSLCFSNGNKSFIPYPTLPFHHYQTVPYLALQRGMGALPCFVYVSLSIGKTWLVKTKCRLWRNTTSVYKFEVMYYETIPNVYETISICPCTGVGVRSLLGQVGEQMGGAWVGGFHQRPIGHCLVFLYSNILFHMGWAWMSDPD